jgi:hypothetical protein
VDEANDRLKRRHVEKKELAKSLTPVGVSEMMVLRALHPKMDKRVATIETLNAISDALGLPRPVIVATSYEQAFELQKLTSFDAADATRMRISAEIDRERALQAPAKSSVDGIDGRTRTAREVDDSRPRTAQGRSSTVRRAPRAR